MLVIIGKIFSKKFTKVNRFSIKLNKLSGTLGIMLS
jgi:hypothetical protein